MHRHVSPGDAVTGAEGTMAVPMHAATGWPAAQNRSHMLVSVPVAAEVDRSITKVSATSPGWLWQGM